MPIPSSQQRLRQAAACLSRRVLARVEPSALLPAPAPAPAPAPPPPEEFYDAPPRPRTLAVEAATATRRLRERLDDATVAAAEARIAEVGELQDLYVRAEQPDVDRLLLSYAMHLGVDAVAEQTGLTRAEPPEEVHAMARGPMAAAGGLYEADMVLDALASAGVDLSSIRSGLDFGCSSGRVLRVLAATCPEIAWCGCDPNGPATAWANETVPGARVFQSGNEPPLDLADRSLDLVYAISIWSHFAPALGLAWLEEMRRLVRPGGHLVLTTHGTVTMEYDALHGLRTAAQLDRARHHVAVHGAWYAAEFGEEGDWGVVNPQWGTAFLSAEWLLAHATPQWRLLEYAPGRNGGNQDVYVLQRA